MSEPDWDTIARELHDRLRNTDASRLVGTWAEVLEAALLDRTYHPSWEEFHAQADEIDRLRAELEAQQPDRIEAWRWLDDRTYVVESGGPVNEPTLNQDSQPEWQDAWSHMDLNDFTLDEPGGRRWVAGQIAWRPVPRQEWTPEPLDVVEWNGNKYRLAGPDPRYDGQWLARGLADNAVSSIPLAGCRPVGDET